MILTLAAVALAGCHPLHGRAEFAPPEYRWPATLPSAVARNAPAPPVPIQYCYRTLADTDCYLSREPKRANFSGIYPIPGQY